MRFREEIYFLMEKLIDVGYNPSLAVFEATGFLLLKELNRTDNGKLWEMTNFHSFSSLLDS